MFCIRTMQKLQTILYFNSKIHIVTPKCTEKQKNHIEVMKFKMGNFVLCDESSSLLFFCPSPQMTLRWRCVGIIHQLPGQSVVSVSCILWHFLFCFSFDGFVHNRSWAQPPGFVKRCVEYASFLKLLLQDLNSVSKPTPNFT